jgi:hypothetical protein
MLGAKHGRARVSQLVPDIGIPIINTRENEDETALAQLGAAAVLHWHEVPPRLRDKLLQAAELVAGVPSIQDARQRLNVLIEANATRGDTRHA